jgi:hypothetical protein
MQTSETDFIDRRIICWPMQTGRIQTVDSNAPDCGGYLGLARSITRCALLEFQQSLPNCAAPSFGLLYVLALFHLIHETIHGITKCEPGDVPHKSKVMPSIPGSRNTKRVASRISFKRLALRWEPLNHPNVAAI